MVLPLHLPNNEISTHRSHTLIGHRVMSSCGSTEKYRFLCLAQKKIVWKFNPPGAPHFGGIWERLVQSCKKVMISTLDNRSLTDEVLSTTMCLVEQTLNARLLTAVSDHPEVLTALRPNPFLLGQEKASAPFMPSRFVKTQKWSKLKIFTSWDRKSVHPPDFWKAKSKQPGVMAHG